MAASADQFTPVATPAESDALEQEVLAYWAAECIFERSLEQTRDKPLFSFFDGPPYATGKAHYGHVLQSAIKDTVLRYKTMQGHYVPRRVGWDCHGLPVETLVEKELGLKSKKDIETMGVAAFNDACRKMVFRYIDDFTSTLKRIGRWAEYDQAYATLEPAYMESEWWVFKQLWDQQLIYQAFRSTPYCIRCATPLSNFEVASSYKDTTDAAVYVALPVTPASVPEKLRDANRPLSLLVWTTTPWTLPGNVAVAMNPDIAYVEVKVGETNSIVAQDAVERLFGSDAENIRSWSTAELQQLAYEPLYDFFGIRTTPDAPVYRLVAAPHVTSTDGTGLVHIAPAFGEEDAAVGLAHHLPVIRSVGTDGNFTAEVTPWAGQNIFMANKSIVSDLKERGLLWRQEAYRHSYPFCWRCDTPLIYYALDSWFVKVNDLKERMQALNEHINWTPKHVQHGRFGKGISSAPDWAVSRNRYWSVPLPIWQCSECTERVCVGSITELQALSGVSDIPDLHRPYIDAVTWSCAQCSGTMKRVPEVLDVWFDAGSMPYAQWHYPFEHKEETEQRFPADFIVESIEQTRLWFYVLHVLAAALTKEDIGLGKDTPAFKNAIGSGLILSEKGQKLSKKLKNYPELEPTIAKYGADVLRFYLLSSTSLGEPYRFSEKDLRQLQRTTYLTLWNVYAFFVQYARTHDITREVVGDAPTSHHLLDTWILARVAQLEYDVLTAMDTYQVDQGSRAFIGFIDDLSNWYVRRSRARFQPAHTDAHAAPSVLAAFGTLYEVLVRTTTLLAPFMPFVAEHMYRNLTGKDSVHLASLPTIPPITAAQQKILTVMAQVWQVVSLGLSLRAQAGIKIRQPLSELIIQKTDGLDFTDELLTIIAEELNVKQVRLHQQLPDDAGWVSTPPEERLRVALATVLTPELQQEGIAREIIRHGQMLRKKAGYALGDRIVVMIATESEVIRQVLAHHQAVILGALQADALAIDVTTPDAVEEIVVSDHGFTIAVRKEK